MSTTLKAANSQPDFPNKWEEISTKLSLDSVKDVKNFILEPSFLEPWVAFRDLLPLQPSHPTDFQPKDRDALNELSTEIYNLMDAMSTSIYDLPAQSDHELWTANDHFKCLIYQASSNLARHGRPFAEAFDRKMLKNEAGRNKAPNRIPGLIFLGVNLTINYTIMVPSNVIRSIEDMRPAANLEWSPIKAVRVKFQLDNMDVNDLRKKALGSEKKGKNEKEWLIGMIMGKQGLAPHSTQTAVKVERAATPGLKRVREDAGEEDGGKRAKTTKRAIDGC
jgi:hypothetical protein